MRHHFRILQIALLFYTIQNKSEKKIHAMIMHTFEFKLNLFFLEPYHSCQLSRIHVHPAAEIHFFRWGGKAT
jgi:hypothetical protein